ncbi:LysE/ArgO family amino acid transporter [Varunaivibrio sulfuroxidans]|nr:LysE/ArgO family amino acid transporter [Varunaivibrio sulfuroxidans]WES31237.1 LysE/ArgO family amino acid transporter [Varunaivibrio sulfuroxidans]
MVSFSSPFVSPALEGFALGAGLIVAIGAQNAFVLRQGLKRRHVFAVATVCFLSDVVLIALGAGGMGTLVSSHQGLLVLASLGGGAFLIAYGYRSLRAAFHPGVLKAAVQNESPSLRATLATALALTYLNPHVYLDTVVLLGSVAGRHVGAERVAFALGASFASMVWFYTLGYGAGRLAPLFAKPISWRVLDGLIAIVMWTIAFSLLKPYVLRAPAWLAGVW